MSPMLEDMVLLNVVKEIDPRLPSHVRSHYALKMSKSEKLMDFKSDIMTNIPKFLQELDKEEQLGSIQGVAESQLKWIKQQKGGNQRRQMPWQAKGNPAVGGAGNQSRGAGNQSQKF